MTATKPSKSIQKIYAAQKSAHGEYWQAAVAELEPAINMIMRDQGHSDPMQAVTPLILEMKSRKQDPSRLIAIAYEMGLKRTKKGWTV